MMKLSMFARIFLAVLLACTVAACDPDEQPSTPQPSPGGSDAGALLPLTFYHIQDSDGGKAGAGVDVIFIFEPDGIADIYVARDEEAIAYKGNYSVKDGKIALKFNDADMQFDVSFNIDTSKSTVTMPFKAFSGTAGTSTWRLERRPIEQNLQVVFAAATMAENLSTNQAIGRVVKYANAVAAAARAGKRAFAKISADPELTDVKPLANGVELQYDKGPFVSVQLYSWSVSNGQPLSMSPLAGDPRVHLDPKPPHNGISDPPEKTALLYAPFDGDRKTIIWYDYDFLNRYVTLPSREPIQKGWSTDDQTTEMASVLEDNGYHVNVLRDESAGLVELIEALLPGKDGRSHSPGFIGISTHGSDDGTLMTGSLLGDSSDWQDEYNDVIADLKASGYGDLLTYGGGTEANPRTIEVSGGVQSLRVQRLYYAISITPKFWEWLRSRQADFSRSFVYVGACLTDQTKDLREAIRARAYFAYKIPVASAYCGRVFQYFCKSLARPTHSAEETYYNLVRVLSSGQMIYAEDKLLDGLPRGSKAQADSAILNFAGYAFDGQKVLSYSASGVGWLGVMNGDQGGIWWLLFGGRWGQDAQAGAEAMRSCWSKVWKDGNTGGLGNPECHNKTVGRVPTEEEIGCASYLLTGLPVMGDGKWLIPRWTLNDGR